MRRGKLWIELIFEKERPEPKTEGRVVGMDSNYRNGLVFSDGQQVGLAGVYGLRSLPSLTFDSAQN